jgi:hypothetical protein
MVSTVHNLSTTTTYPNAFRYPNVKNIAHQTPSTDNHALVPPSGKLCLGGPDGSGTGLMSADPSRSTSVEGSLECSVLSGFSWLDIFSELAVFFVLSILICMRKLCADRIGLRPGLW